MSVGIYRTFASTVKKYWVSYLVGTAALLVTSVTEVLMPKFIQWTVDLLTKKEQASIPSWFQAGSLETSLDKLVGYFILSLLIGWLGRIGWRQMMARRTHVSGHLIKTRFWNVLKDQPLSFLHRYPLGDLMNRATGDWNKTRFIHGFTIVMTFDIIFFSLLALVSMFLIDVQLALACLFLMPFLPRPIIRLSKKEYDQHQKAQELLSELSDAISQAVNTVRLQRATNSEVIWEQQLTKRASRYAAQHFEVLKIIWKIFVLGALPTIAAYAILFSFGIYKFQNGDISIGQFIALQSYILLLQSPLFELGSVISEWQTGFASYARILEIFGYELKPKQTDPKGMTIMSRQDEAVSMKNLSFRYSADFPYVLKNINFTVRAGEKIGIIGAIGAGKTTLIQILTGLSEHFQGELYLFGLPMSKLGRDWLCRNITVVPQKPFLFAGSIRSNLCLDQNFTAEEMIRVLKVVRLWDDVQSMPQQLDTWIGEWGINLSGGQKQRLAIARALLRPTPILILDDCLSAVDSVTEEYILNQLQGSFQHQTLIWTAHRASTLQLCDRIYQLANGQLLELEQQPNTSNVPYHSYPTNSMNTVLS